jgi:hypothetical protein
MISVDAVVQDVIVLNIPNALSRVIDKVEVRMEERQGPSDSATQTKTPIMIIFTASIMISASRQRVVITIPQRFIGEIEKGSAYFAKVSDRYT